MAAEPAFASGRPGLGGGRQSHSSVHCGRKGKRLKMKTQMLLRSSPFPFAGIFGFSRRSAEGDVKSCLLCFRHPCGVRWLGGLALGHKNWQPGLHICLKNLEYILLSWSPQERALVQLEKQLCWSL